MRQSQGADITKLCRQLRPGLGRGLAAAAEAQRMYREAERFELRILGVPTNSPTIPGNGFVRERLAVRPGSIVLGVGGGSDQPEDARVRVSEIGSSRELFPRPLMLSTLTTSQASPGGFRNRIHLLREPWAIGQAGLWVRIDNLSPNVANIQFVLHLMEPEE